MIRNVLWRNTLTTVNNTHNSTSVLLSKLTLLFVQRSARFSRKSASEYEQKWVYAHWELKTSSGLRMWPLLVIVERKIVKQWMSSGMRKYHNKCLDKNELALSPVFSKGIHLDYGSAFIWYLVHDSGLPANPSRTDWWVFFRTKFLLQNIVCFCVIIPSAIGFELRILVNFMRCKNTGSLHNWNFLTKWRILQSEEFWLSFFGWKIVVSKVRLPSFGYCFVVCHLIVLPEQNFSRQMIHANVSNPSCAQKWWREKMCKYHRSKYT